MDDNVIVVQFDEPSKAYQALSELNHLGDEGKVDVRSAVLLERNQDGSVRVPEGADNSAGLYVLSGGLLGMLVGALAGPAGLLLGASFGALGGAPAKSPAPPTMTSRSRPSARASCPGVLRSWPRSRSLPRKCWTRRWPRSGAP